ncbi:MAG: hypothetical protein ABI598_02090, partial [Chloroflexota bacterium]
MRPGAFRARLVPALSISAAAGLATGSTDSRPGWDDTAVTAVALVVASAVASYLAGRAPWLWAITTGIWVPLFELPGQAGGGALAALLF